MKTLKSATLVCAIAAASMGFSSLSFAQNQDFRHGRQARPQVQQQQQHHHHHQPHHGQQHAPQVIPHHAVRPIVIDNRQSNRLDHRDMRRHDRRYYNNYYNARGPEFRRGGYIPREFRNRHYVVNDYRAYRLAPPPRGQQWVQVGGDYVLIGIATGLIASVILNH